MVKEQVSLLLFLEDCCVNKGGKVNMNCINKVDTVIIETWKDIGFVQFGRIKAADLTESGATNWVELSDDAWDMASKERKERAKRSFKARKWRKTTE